MSATAWPTRQDVDLIYGVDIDTEKGSALFEFRNSSNGYYGSSIDLASDHWRKPSDESLATPQAITADFQFLN
jgi:hypothetical protein